MPPITEDGALLFNHIRKRIVFQCVLFVVSCAICGTIYNQKIRAERVEVKLDRLRRSNVQDDEGTDVQIKEGDDEEGESKPYEHQKYEDFVLSWPQNVTLSVGDSHSFNCGPSHKKSVAMWMKDLSFLAPGMHILPGLEVLPNKTLIITYMTWRLKGRYTCIIASVEDLEARNVWVSLKDEDKPDTCNLSFDYAPQATVDEENGFTFLRCSAHHADITWEKDGQPVTTDHNLRVINLLPGLLVINRTVYDFESYTCIATNHQLGCSISMKPYVALNQQKKHDPTCGQPALNEASVGVSKNATTLAKGAAPWQAMLWEQRVGFFCAGSLVSEEWIVTAAHCIAFFSEQQGHQLQKQNLYVKLGKHDANRKEPHEQTVPVSEIILHPHYEKVKFESDIALVRLKNRVDLSVYIMPICLETEQFLNYHVYDQPVFGIVTGWGKLQETSKPTTMLTEVHFLTNSEKVCKASTYYTVTKNMFCAEFEHDDTCAGFGGGPFVIKENLRWYLAGIVSWGEGCGQKGKRSFYTKVGNFYSWIKENIQEQ